MADTTIHVQATSAEVLEAIRHIPEVARTGGRAANAMLRRCGIAALGRIREAFVVKARGGTDDAGDRWAPLSPRTIAGRNRSRGKGGRTRTEKKRPLHPSQALNARQRERWWLLYKQGLARYGNGPGGKASAAKRAWWILKQEGAQTLVEKYGARQVEILRDTGLLLNSLSPGNRSGAGVFRMAAGMVIVGTTRRGAVFHHRGIPGRLPMRRLWPPPDKWPASWWGAIIEQALLGLVDITVEVIKEA